MSAERRVAKNAAWLVLQPLVMNVLSLAATGYIARRLGATELGRFNLAYAFVAMFAPLSNLGIRSLAIRHMAQQRDTAAAYLGRVLMLRVLLAVASALLAIFAAPLSGGSGQTRMVITVAALSMVVTTIGQVLTDGFQSFEIMRPASVAQFLGGLLLTVTSVIVIKWGGGIGQMALAYALGPLCTLLFLNLWIRGQRFRPRPCWDGPMFAQLLRQAMPFFLMAVLDVMSTRLDVVVLARMLGGASLGCYTTAMSLVDRALYLADGAGTALLPAVSHLCAQSPASAVPLLRKSILWLMLLSLPIAIFTGVFAPLVIRVIFGSQFTAAAPILAIAIWRLPALCLSLLEARALFAVNREDLVLRTEATAMVLTISLMFPLIHSFGPIGGAMALTVRPVVGCLLRMRARARCFPSFWPTDQLPRVAAALTLMSLPLTLVPFLGPGLMPLLLVPVSLGIYLVCLAVMRVVPVVSLAHALRQRAAQSVPLLRWAADGSQSGN